jgi:hypothetical protein
MPRKNPGPFEPVLYVIHTQVFFRVIGVGGPVLFTLVFLTKAAEHSAGAFVFGLALLAALLG